MNDLLSGDCECVLTDFDNSMFDLIVTSPPYADNRKKTYSSMHPDKYVEWFLPKTEEFYRVLKPSGTFILNIKEKVVNGQRHTYVIDLIKGMMNQGWLWTEEFVWHKKNCFPGKWSNRFRDAWERCIQFNKNPKFKMNQDAVMVPIGDWSKSRLKNLSDKDKTRDESKVGSGFGKNISNWIGRDKVYPTNVLSLATECSNKNHSAAFPIGLPKWFIQLFTDEGDVVLDPFVGSGTTAVAAKLLNRKYIGIDKSSEFISIAEQNIKNCN